MARYLWLLLLVSCASGGIEPWGVHTPDEAIAKFGAPCSATLDGSRLKMEWGVARAPTLDEPFRYLIQAGECNTLEHASFWFDQNGLAAWAVGI